MANKNFNKLVKMNKDKYEGKCIGLADGKVVVVNKDPVFVMDKLMKDYSGKEILATSIPKRGVNFVL